MLNFLGVFGNVIRVKIMFNKKDTALIEFENADHASNGKIASFF